MKRIIVVFVALMASFLSGWIASPGRNNIEFETIRKVPLDDQSKQIGSLPEGTRVFAEGYIAPDVGFVGCVPVDFGDSLRVNAILKRVGKLTTSFSRGGEGQNTYLSVDISPGHQGSP